MNPENILKSVLKEFHLTKEEEIKLLENLVKELKQDFWESELGSCYYLYSLSK